MIRKTVPCGPCRACCIGQRPLLEADEIGHYQAEPVMFRGIERQMVAHKPNGECCYLGAEGCTIYDRAPKTCQDFDCRVWFLEFPVARRELMLTTEGGTIGQQNVRIAAHAAKARLTPQP